MPPRRAAGFTLVELVIVLAIVGLSLAMVVPLLGRSLPGAALNAAAAELRAALREARLTAIAEDRAVTFRADVESGYWLDRQYRPLAAAARGAGGVRLVTAAPIAFYASGGSSGGRVFVDGAGGRREIDVDAASGHARLAP